MAKMSVQGLDEYALRLSNLSKNTEQIVRQEVYEGAGVVADSIKSGLRQIPVDNGRGTEDRKLHGVTNRQKADLIDAFGLAPIENSLLSLPARLYTYSFSRMLRSGIHHPSPVSKHLEPYKF